MTARGKMLSSTDRKKEAVSPSLVRDVFDYRDGNLYWKTPTSRRVKPGQIAGAKGPGGRVWVGLYGARIYLHRLIWAWHYERWPAQYIDHINGDNTDNRIENLRECSQAQNQQNRGVNKNNVSGHPGVRYAHKKWRVQIGVNYKSVHIGSFDTFEQAVSAYKKAKRKIHPFDRRTPHD